MAPTLATACAALPPEGANPTLGRPGGGVVLPPTLDGVAPTLGTACPSLPPEGANPPWGGPAVDSFAPTLEGVAPTLATACAALPPEGANPPWGGPAVDSFAPTLGTACPSLPPRGGEPHLGAARRWIALPPRLPLRVLRCPPGGLSTLGRPGSGLRCPPQDLLCLPCTNLADQAGGAFGAAASRRRPQAGGQPQRRMPRRPGPRHGPAKPDPLHHPADRIQTWPLGGRRSRRPAQLCTKQMHRCTVSQTNLADQAGGAFGAAASRRRPQAGGQPQRRMPRRPGPRHGPAARAALPPEGANPALGRPGGGVVAPTLAAARTALPPEGANPALGRPGGGLIWPGRVGRV